MKGAIVKIALIQVASPDDESVEDRRKRVERLVSQAEGCELVVLPELWAAGYFSFPFYRQHAETPDGPTVSNARRWALRLGCYVHAGSYIESAPGGRLYNATALVAPDGSVVHRYRKVHVFGYQSLEQELLTPGSTVSTAAVPWGMLGATTCYDLRFPEIWRGLIDIGAELVVTPAAWPADRLEHWRLFTTARAVENQLLVIGCNAAGRQGDVALAGHSRVVDPWGNLLVEAGVDEGIVTVEVDHGVIARTRREFPVLQDRYRAFVRSGATATATAATPNRDDPPDVPPYLGDTNSER